MYCGLGTPAGIVSYDPRSGRFADLLEGAHDGAAFARNLRFQDGWLLSELSGGARPKSFRVKVHDKPLSGVNSRQGKVRITSDGRYRVVTRSPWTAGFGRQAERYEYTGIRVGAG